MSLSVIIWGALECHYNRCVCLSLCGGLWNVIVTGEFVCHYVGGFGMP